MSSLVATYTAKRLVPSAEIPKARRTNVNLAPSTVFASGTVLGIVSDTANDVQTVATSGTPTGGTIKLSGVDPVSSLPFTTAAVAYNAAAAALASAVQKAIQAVNPGGTVAGSGSALTSGNAVLTFGGSLAGVPVQSLTLSDNSLTGGTSPSATVTHTTTGRTAETYKAYAGGNSDGSQTAKCILEFDCATDASGNVTYGSQAGGGEWGQTRPYATAFFSGSFLLSDLTGLDADAVTDLGGHTTGTSTTVGELIF